MQRLEHSGSDGARPTADMTVEEAGFTLFLTFEDGTETIRQAWFYGPSGTPETAVLDLLCDYAGGAPVRELFEHGLIYAMRELRDPEVEAPVTGILTPRNAGECFRTPLSLMAGLRRQANARFGRHTDTNFFDRPYSAAWNKLDMDGKRDHVVPHIESFKVTHGIPTGAFELVQIDQYDRLFVVFADDVPVWEKPAMLMDLERWLRAKTGERIELFTEVVKDANRIRRL